MKKTVVLTAFFLVAEAVFGQELINNIENNHFINMGNIGRILPDGLERRSYYEYYTVLFSYMADDSELVSAKEIFETNGEIVTKYSIVTTFHNSIPDSTKLHYIDFFDAFFSIWKINPSDMKKSEENNSRYANGAIMVDNEKYRIVIKLSELEYETFSQQAIEISLR
ncbi:MAG: hypothetical protein LBG94_06440 [Treponema sp.]|nr:hypothetical protein [Treponema sp.]